MSDGTVIDAEFADGDDQQPSLQPRAIVAGDARDARGERFEAAERAWWFRQPALPFGRSLGRRRVGWRDRGAGAGDRLGGDHR